MTPGELKIYEAIMELKADKAAFRAQVHQELKTINEKLDRSEKAIEKTDLIVAELVTIKNRGIGAFWLGGLIGGSGTLAFLYSLFKGH